MKVKFGWTFFQRKLLSAHLSHKVCRLVRVLFIPSPQSAVLIFMLPDLKRFTLRSILLQGYNKSLITSLFLGKRLSHDTCRLWIAVGVTFPLETRNTPSLQGDRHLVCSRATSGFTLSFPLIFPPHIRQSASRSWICSSMTLDRKEIT